YPDRIVLGQSAALEGPAAALGRDLNLGILAAFAEANRAGGVHGRRLELISRDDGYEPTRAIANTHELLDQHKVFALIGQVGTPTARAVVPIAEQQGVPFLAPFTGAGFLRNPDLSSVINVRASYEAEAEKGIGYLVDQLGLDRVAVLFQDDTFGRDGLAAVERALLRRNLELAGDATYQRNTVAVKRAALDLRALKPEAVFIIGAYAPAAEFILLCRQIGFAPRFMTLSFVGSSALAEALGSNGKDVLITQVMPLFTDNRHPLVQRFNTALPEYDSEAKVNFVVLEGYAAGRLVVTALEAAGPEVTRQGFLELLRSGRMADLDGMPLRFGIDSNQGSSEVFLTEIRADGSFIEVGQ
ncbi:MAG TPA: ABC transporter substrate-binding protein, partial [Xanthomonadales bacterium]|nr:ABC transporter substrate-binding protein [Xanthomonadales bacterium]